MTLRAWKTLVLGAVMIAAAGGFAATQGRSSSSIRPSAHWGLYTSAKWDGVAATFARRGFPRNSVRIVTAARLTNGQPFALIGARSTTGDTCFEVARGTVLGATSPEILAHPRLGFSTHAVSLTISGASTN